MIEGPLYQCAISVTVHSYEPNATIEVDVNGTVTAAPGGFPFPNGVTVPLPTALVAGDKIKARQRIGGVTSGWTATILVRDHTQDYPAGLPRPEINPAPVYKCGVRTCVGNLLPGGHVWIEADAVKVGEVNGCATQQVVLHCWDSQRPLPPVGLRDEHPAHRLGPVSLLHQFLPQFQKKPQRSFRRDRFDGFAIDARGSAVTPNLLPCKPQHLQTADLVKQNSERS